MARKNKAAELPANPMLLTVAAMKFWLRFQNPPPMLAFPFAESFDTDDETTDVLARLPQVPTDDTVGYSLRISLNGMKPPVWRRIHVRPMNLETLHHVIQFAMGWHDSHLHEFEIGKAAVPLVEDGGAINERTISLAQIHAAKIKKFEYTYDFGDDWRHTILIEQTLDATSVNRSPECVAGKGICPIEDIGGLLCWKKLVEAVTYPQNERDEETQDLLDRIGDDFASQPFDRDGINARLQRAFDRRVHR